MSFNINKCHTLHAHGKEQPIIHTYTMDNTPVTPVTHHPYLGIELQSDLRWTTHIQNTTNKPQNILNILKRNLKQASTAEKSQTYETIVRPQIEYASAIWNPHTAKYTYNLNKIQNYAARWVHHDYSPTQVSLPYKNNRIGLLFRSESIILENLPSEYCNPHPPPYLQIPLRTTRHTSNITKTATDTDNSAHQQIHTNTATFPEQSETGIHCHPVCVRLQRCSPSRKA